MSQRVSVINQMQKWQLSKPISAAWLPYAQTTLIIAACTGLIALLFPGFEPVNLILVYLLGVVITAAYLGRGPSIFASCLSVAAFDFFFVKPYFTFAVYDPQYIVTFIFMLIIALLVSNLTIQIKQHAHTAIDRERVTANLYALSDVF